MLLEPMAAKRAVNLSLNDDLVRQARGFTRNLSATIEELLAAFVSREQARERDADRALARVIDVMNDFHAETGLLSDEFQAL